MVHVCLACVTVTSRTWAKRVRWHSVRETAVALVFVMLVSANAPSSTPGATAAFGHVPTCARGMAHAWMAGSVAACLDGLERIATLNLALVTARGMALVVTMCATVRVRGLDATVRPQSVLRGVSMGSARCPMDVLLVRVTQAGEETHVARVLVVLNAMVMDLARR
jgi:hypothetical protein